MLDTERGEGIASGAPAGVFVQLASFRDSAPAQLERDRLSSVLREWMADRPLLEVRRLSGSATYFAVILPGFEGRIDAENFCAAIPSRLTDCWVRGN
nr:SPOR domain-containing protein [Rhodovibrio sodomensis]